MIEAHLVQLLRADTYGVFNIVGDSVFFGPAPQGTALPLVSIKKVSLVDRPTSHNAQSKTIKDRFQFTCLGNHPLQAAQLAEAVRTLLDDYSGTLQSTTVQSTQHVNNISLTDQDLGSAELLDYFVTHRPSS